MAYPSANRVIPAFFILCLSAWQLEITVEADETAESPYRETGVSQRSLKVPKIDTAGQARAPSVVVGLKSTAIVIDGRLDDPLWEQAETNTGFWSSLVNRPPADPTEVLVMMDEDYLYFGFRLYDSDPGSIRARRAVRDAGFGYDDVITVELDTFFNRRDISRFSLNPLGTQSDSRAGGRADKVEWKGDWLGAAKRTEFGWSAEFAIPFEILNYRPTDTVFGLNFKRYQSRTHQFSWWSDVTPQNLPEQMGVLTGLELPVETNRQAWTFMPFVLAGRNIPDKQGDIQDTFLTGGIDIRYRPRSDWTAVISLNPDFSQVEEAVTDISFSYNEKAVADNRPFFAEGRGYFSAKNEYFYSNRAADFDYGAKTFGRLGANRFAALATSAPEGRRDFAGRWLHEFDETQNGSASIVATQQEGFDNVLGVARFGGRRQNGFRYSADAAVTDTRNIGIEDPRNGRGTHLEGSLGWSGDHWSAGATADLYDDNYFPALALLNGDLPGTRGHGASLSYYREQSDGPWRVLEGYAGHILRHTEAGEVQNRKWYAGGSMELQSQIRTTLYAESGPYRPTASRRGEFVDFMYQDSYYSAAVDFLTRSSVLSFGGQYDWGDLAGADYRLFSFYALWSPINVLDLQATYEKSESFGDAEQTILSGSWQITPEDSVGGRIIYYKSSFGNDEYYRLAYGRRVRQGIDLFFVYDNSPYIAEQYSVKLVRTF